MKRVRPWIIFAVCYLSYCSIYIARVNLSVASPELISLGALTSAQFGLLGSVFSIVYACGRLISGRLSDRYPPYVMICAGLAAAGISNLVFGFLPPFPALLVLWGCNAFAQSMLWGSVLRIVTAIYPPEIVRQYTSLMVTTVSTGTIVGFLLDAQCVTRIGLPFAFFLPGLFCLFCCLLTALFTGKIHPTASGHSEKAPSLRGQFTGNDYRSKFLPAFLHGIMKDNISLWLPAFFVFRYRIDLQQISLFVIIVPAVGLIGRLAYPAFFKLCGSRDEVVTRIGFVICALASVLLCTDIPSPILTAAAFGLLYAAVSMINTSFLSIYPIRFAGKNLVATVSGIMDFLTYLGAAVGSAVYGALVEPLGYSVIFVSWAVVSVAGLILVLFSDWKKG